jgi:hypothetical protein
VRKVLVLAVTVLCVTILQGFSQAEKANNQVVVFADGYRGAPAEVTMNDSEVVKVGEGAYHSFWVSGAAFVFVQTTGKMDKEAARAYLVSPGELAKGPCYLQISRPMLSGVISIVRIDEATAKTRLSSLKEAR